VDVEAQLTQLGDNFGIEVFVGQQRFLQQFQPATASARAMIQNIIRIGPSLERLGQRRHLSLSSTGQPEIEVKPP
jgi:hypothetical protein